MSLEERRQVLLNADKADFGIYDIEVEFFLKHFEEMEHVKSVGGLHVIGSERHDARRIDNQLRGRAGRQGDPGSSRFFLSLEDDLMRLFGGEQVGNLMERLKVDDSLPLENKIVANIIEQSQHRVEGANFDVREHLLEYDDVLNSQRERIYAQRDRVFTKEDLSEDITDMIQFEVDNRVATALADEEEGPWRLLAWLDGVQPSFNYGKDEIFSSFGLQILLDELEDAAEPEAALLDLMRRAIIVEQEHLLKAIQSLIVRTGESLETQLDERFDLLDTFIQGQSESEELRRPQEKLVELNSLTRINLRLSNNQLRILGDDAYDLEDDLREMIQSQLTKISTTRLIGTIENRIGAALNINKNELAELDGRELENTILDATEAKLAEQIEALSGENGQLAKDLANALKREPVEAWSDTINARLLMGLAQGVRTVFDARTHRQVKQKYSRVQYIFIAAQTLVDAETEDLKEDVLDHLDAAQDTLRGAWGENEWNQLAPLSATLADFGPATATLIPELLSASPASLSDEDRESVTDVLGHFRMTETQRQLLLGAITEQWVEYLTRVEALRVSIGLEAYGQRDPLVQYKTKASLMFQELMGEIRAQVISRVFAYQPRRWNVQSLGSESAAPVAAPATKSESKPSAGKKKRKRHKKK